MGKTYRIAVVPGDGTGSEVVAEGIKVLEAVAARSDFALEFTRFNLGGEHFMATGELLPDETLKALATYDAIYLGAIGHPDVKPGILEKGILLSLRFHFDQYINLRPIRLYEGVQTPLKNKGPEGYRFRRGSGEHRGTVCRRRRLSETGHSGRGRGAGIHQHPQRR